MTQITNERLEELKKNKGIMFIDFMADWCRPCSYLSEQLESIVFKYEDKVRFAKVNIEDENDAVVKYGIKSIPMVIIFKDGEEEYRAVGMRPNSEYESTIIRLLNG